MANRSRARIRLNVSKVELIRQRSVLEGEALFVLGPLMAKV